MYCLTTHLSSPCASATMFRVFEVMSLPKVTVTQKYILKQKYILEQKYILKQKYILEQKFFS